MAEKETAGTQPRERSATRGLATIALLKTNFDAGRDHISMFEPFVQDALAHMSEDGVTTEEVREAVLARHQLSLPISTVRTVLGRVVKRGFQRREGGRYFRTNTKPPVPDLQVERQRIEERQRGLADALREASNGSGIEIRSTEEALGMVLNFLDKYHVALALDRSIDTGPEAATPPIDEAMTDRRMLLTAAFLRDIVLAGGELASVVQEMLEGFVLQSTLLLKDISTAARRFKNLGVFFDSGLLFGALGYRGSASEVAAKELLSLLRDTGASLEVFEPTIREMRRILTVYENRIGTHEGRLTLYQGDLTRHFLTHRYTPSDIRMMSSLLEKDLRALGFRMRDLPPHQAALTLDEDRLGALLAARPGEENVPRVVHDIDCVAGVLTLRRGSTSDSLDYASAVFVTLSGLTVRHTCEWYKEQGGGGFPPIIHYLLLSNLAWLKRPASASRLKLHELVALCTAALRPSREAWGGFIRHLKKLEESGELSSDEVTAIVASSLTDRILVEEEVDEDSDAETLSEVIERVKSSYQAKADAEVRRARSEVETSEAEVDRVHRHLQRRSRSLGKVASWFLAVLLATSFLAGTGLGIVDAANGTRPGLLVIVAGLVPLGVAALFSVLWGFHLKAWRQAVEDRVTTWLRGWMSGSS